MFIFTIGNRDKVVKLGDLPRSSLGAAKPVVLADESVAVVAYHTYESASAQDNVPTEIAVVTFIGHRATLFGPPDDEAILSHPLFKRGLRPYGNFLVENSSWVRKLSRPGADHSDPHPELTEQPNHYILAFHDSTFECAADSYRVELFKCTMREAIAAMTKKLQ